MLPVRMMEMALSAMMKDIPLPGMREGCTCRQHDIEMVLLGKMISMASQNRIWLLGPSQYDRECIHTLEL